MTPEYVEAHTIFECVVGSQAYGTHNEFSDTDYAGVMIPGYTNIFLGKKELNNFKDIQNLTKLFMKSEKH